MKLLQTNNYYQTIIKITINCKVFYYLSLFKHVKWNYFRATKILVKKNCDKSSNYLWAISSSETVSSLSLASDCAKSSSAIISLNIFCWQNLQSIFHCLWKFFIVYPWRDLQSSYSSFILQRGKLMQINQKPKSNPIKIY